MERGLLLDQSPPGIRRERAVAADGGPACIPPGVSAGSGKLERFGD